MAAVDHHLAGPLDRLHVEAASLIAAGAKRSHLPVETQHRTAASSGKRHWKDALLELQRHYIGVASAEAVRTEFVPIGEQLVLSCGEHQFALQCCFEPYLAAFRASVTEHDVRFCLGGRDVFMDPSSPAASHVLRAVTIAALCRFMAVITDDLECAGESTVNEALASLECLRQAVRWAQRTKGYDWAVYNCSQHVYQICLMLVASRRSEAAIEPLLWTIVAIESVYTLMSRRHIVWRMRLYVMACECYHQMRMDVQLKALAERGASKIVDLQELEAACGRPVVEGYDDAIDQALALIRPQQVRAVIWTTTKPSSKRRAAMKGIQDNRPHAVLGILELLETQLPNVSDRLPALCQVFPPRRTMNHCPLQLDEMPRRYGGDRNALNHRRTQTKHIIAAGCELALAEAADAGCRWQLLHQFARLAFALEQFEVYREVSAVLRDMKHNGDAASARTSLGILAVLDAHLVVQSSRDQKKARNRAPNHQPSRKSRFVADLQPFEIALAKLVHAYHAEGSSSKDVEDILHNAARHLWTSSRTFYAGSRSLDWSRAKNNPKIERLAIIHEAFMAAKSGRSNGVSVGMIAILLGDVFNAASCHAEAFSAYSDGVHQIEAYRDALMTAPNHDGATEAASVHMTLLCRQWVLCAATQQEFSFQRRVNLIGAIRNPQSMPTNKTSAVDVMAHLLTEYEADKTAAAVLRTCIAWANGPGPDSSRLLRESEKLLHATSKDASKPQANLPVLLQRGSTTIALKLPDSAMDTNQTFCIYGRHLDPRNDRGKEPVVRLQDTAIAGTNRPLCGSFEPHATLRELRRYHKYVFAVAPVTAATGQVEKIGPTSQAIVTAHELSKLDGWARLGLAGYSCREMDIFFSSLGELWGRFVVSDVTPRDFARAVCAGKSVSGLALRSSAVAAAPRPCVAGFAVMLAQLAYHICGMVGYTPGSIDPEDFVTRGKLRNALVEIPLLAISCAQLIRHERVLSMSLQQVFLLYTSTLYNSIADDSATAIMFKMRDVIADVTSNLNDWAMHDAGRVVSYGQLASMVSYYLLRAAEDKSGRGRKNQSMFFTLTRSLFMYEVLDPFPESLRALARTFEKLGGRHDDSDSIAQAVHVCSSLSRLDDIDLGASHASKTTDGYSPKDIKAMYDAMMVHVPAKSISDVMRDRSNPLMFEALCHVIGRGIATGMYDSALEWATKALAVLLNKEAQVLKAAHSKDVILGRIHRLVNPYIDRTGEASGLLERELSPHQVVAVETLASLLPKFIRDRVKRKRVEAARAVFRQKHLTWQAQLNLLAAIGSAYCNRHGVIKALPEQDITMHFSITHCRPPPEPASDVAASVDAERSHAGGGTTRACVANVNASRIPWGHFRRAANLAERGKNPVQLYNICSTFLEYWYTVSRRQAALPGSLVGAVLATFKTMISASIAVVRDADDERNTSTSGLDRNKATALAVTLFLEGALVACKSDHDAIALDMGSELLLSRDVHAEPAVLHVIVMALHGGHLRACSPGGEHERTLQEVKTLCEASLAKINGSKVAGAVFDAYDNLHALLRDRECFSIQAKADAASRFRAAATLFGKVTVDEEAIPARTRFRMLHASVLHACGDIDEAQSCWEMLLTEVLGVPCTVESLSTVFDINSETVCLASTKQPLVSSFGVATVAIVGTVLAKLAKYSLAKDFDTQKRVSIVAARCFQVCESHDSMFGAGFLRLSGLTWPDIAAACSFLATTLLAYELAGAALPSVNVMITVARNKCRDHDLYAMGLALRARAMMLTSNFSGAIASLTIAGKCREWGLLTGKLEASEFISHQTESAQHHTHDSELNTLLHDQPLWANKIGFHKNAAVVNHIVLLDLSAAAHLKPVTIHCLQIERARLVLQILSGISPEIEGHDPRNDNKPSKIKRRHLPYGTTVNRFLALVKDHLEGARRFGIASGLPTLVLESSMLMSETLLFEGQYRGALTLVASTVSARSTYTGGSNFGAPVLSPVWWLSARIQFARFLFSVGQHTACLDECRGISSDAATVNERTIVLGATDLEMRCKVIRGKSDLALADIHKFAEHIKACLLSETLKMQYRATLAAALDHCGETSEAHATISAAIQDARKWVAPLDSRDYYGRLIHALGAGEALRANLCGKVGDTEGLIDAAEKGLTCADGGNVYRQPFVLIELRLIKSSCIPETYSLSQLKEVLLLAVESGRILLARRACIAAVKLAIDSRDATAATLFMGTSHAIYTLRKRVKDASMTHEIDAPKHVALGPAGAIAAPAVDVWDDRHDIAATAPAAAPVTSTIEGAELFALREGLERAASLAPLSTSLRISALMDDMTRALVTSPHFSLSVVKDYAARQTLAGTKVASAEGGISFMWDNVSSIKATLYIVCSAPRIAPFGHQLHLHRAAVFELQKRVRDCVTGASATNPEELALHIESVLGVAMPPENVCAGNLDAVDKLLNVRDGGGEIGGSSSGWLTAAFKKCVK